MDAVTRSALVLAAAALLVVPLVNALVLEAQETADRQVTDPPEEVPPQPPPPSENSSETREDLPAAQARTGGGNCTPVPEDGPVVRWSHPHPAQQPGAAAQARAQSPAEQGFRISELHPAARVQLNVSDLTGALEARVYPGDDAASAPFTVDVQNQVGEDLERGTTLTRAGALSTGDWTAALDADGATYSELAFNVVRAVCQEGSP